MHNNTITNKGEVNKDLTLINFDKTKIIQNISVEIFNKLINLYLFSKKNNDLNMQEFKTSVDIAYKKFLEVVEDDLRSSLKKIFFGNIS